MTALPTFTILGSGPTVLLLHDADGGHLTFAPQVETLAAAGYRAVAWNMPGYGASPPIEPYGFKGLAERCTTLVRALAAAQGGPGGLAVVGHGMGAMVALELAVRQPALVERMVFCGGLPAWSADAARDWAGPRLAALDSGIGMTALAERLVPQQIGPGALPEGVRLAQHALAQAHEATYRRALAALASFDRRAVLPQLHLPALFVAGGHDRCAPPVVLREAAAALPGARLHALPGVGHWPQLEAPEEFDALVLDFLAEKPVWH
ncbi:alpha/beta fold hydrolase [Xylophilus sp.]|uniref:alpha/beta fold hydrolase n=1 Tax=Xylophilus sp. TaxID=2653893 RepID=UPI0013BDA758|nr:alpha/beta hydrolase [Xylophilus sp.]KAF1050008.1 MAG: 2-hydroxy-6-oxo-6-phenylhexa-2,4-dienoate hydrolase [Xylophilus sp.]